MNLWSLQIKFCFCWVLLQDKLEKASDLLLTRLNKNKHILQKHREKMNTTIKRKVRKKTPFSYFSYSLPVYTCNKNYLEIRSFEKTKTWIDVSFSKSILVKCSNHVILGYWLIMIRWGLVSEGVVTIYLMHHRWLVSLIWQETF